MKMTYQEFENILLNDEYSIREIRHLFRAVREMDKQSRLWVIKWILFGEFPADEVEGLTAKKLVDGMGFKPMNAFIILDWLKNEPDTAKYFLLKTHHSQDPSEQIGQEMLDFLRSHNYPQTANELEQCDTDVIE